MVQNTKKTKTLKDTPIYLDNPHWTKEEILGEHVVLHTIKPKRVSDQVVSKLYDKDFTLEEIKKNQEIVLSGKNISESTEMKEVRLDKVKITEASIVSIVDQRSSNSKIIEINESAPKHSTDLNEAIDVARARSSTLDYEEKKLLRNTPADEIIHGDFKKIEHERLVFRQEVARNKNSYFFRARDNENLFKIGKNFYDDFKTGYKHFSFSHLGASDAQKKTIIGIASFIHYYENLKILIITNKMDDSFFEQAKTEESRVQAHISVYPEFSYNTYIHEGLNYLEVSEIVAHSQEQKVKGIEYILQKLVDDYDLVFYDLPPVLEKKAQYNIYFPLLQLIQNVSFIVSINQNSFSQIDELKLYFLNYNIKIKGIVVDKPSK